MRSTALLTVVFFFVVLVCGVFSAPSLTTVDTLIAKQKYSEANALLTRRLDSVPTDLKSLYMRLAVEQTKVLDYESYRVESSRLCKTADSVKTIIAGRLAGLTGGDSVAALFYIAAINGFISVLQAKNGDLFPALKHAVESVTMLNDVVRLDPGCNQAYLGIGLVHYYLDKSFKWLPFMDTKSETEDLKKIELATHAPFPYDFAAKNSYCWVLIDHEKLKEADSVAKEVLAHFPENTIFLRIRSLDALWDRRYEQAISFGEKLAQLSSKREPENWSDLVLAYYVIASGNDELGRGKEACNAADFILVTKIPPDFRDIPPIKKNLSKVQSIRKKYSP